jgi:hypothetical protein
MPQPLLHFGDVGIVRQRIRRSRRTQGMHTETVHVGVDTDLLTVVTDNLLVDRGRMEVLVQSFRCVVRLLPIGVLDMPDVIRSTRSS